MLDLELNILNEQIELDEAKKELCLISDRGTGFKKVEATLLSPEFFAHKNKYTGWTITDKASGLLLKNNFNTLAEARDYLKTLTTEELEKINEVKSTEKYKEQCAKLAAANIDDYDLVENFCSSVFEALEEDGQKSLFEDDVDSKSQDIDLSELISNKKIPPENYAAVKTASEWVARHFRKSDRIWPYQLQLMCNAYITEKEVLNLLNKDSVFREKINKELEIFRYKLADFYKFNGKEESHRKLIAGSINKGQCDIIKESEEVKLQDIQFIEVKATIKNPRNATNFHNAEIAFIYLIDKKELYLKIFISDKEQEVKLSGTYDFPCICIVTDDIEIKSYTDDHEERLSKQTLASQTDKVDNS